ncbi:probable helicase with zinc finger domain, partial [Uloborus diversus]|uniref:probable helicase with zinc finger domain n=1 Tax=Uloborus diversus TaxID=327109 RepID=UPI0024090287
MDHFCTYCSVIVGSEAELRAHCNSEGHQLTIMSDEGREWKYRAPARGMGADQYALCLSYSSTGKCRLGQLCCDAHGEEELLEWKERFDYRQMKLQRAKECRLQGRHYTEQLLEKWLTSTNPNLIMTESLDSVELSVEPDLNLTVSEKNCCREWTFHLSAKATLKHVALLYETHRNHFRISLLRSGRVSGIKEYNLGPHCQEWSNADNNEYKYDQYTCKVRFLTSIYGTFRQAIVFDFGFEPVLVQKLCVDVVSSSDMEKLQQARDTAVSFTERWSSNDVTVVPFENRPYSLGEREECLLTCYPAPNGNKFTVTQSVMEPTITKNNYCARQHELLYIEEMAQYELLSRYNVKALLNVTSCYLLTPNSAVTAKYAHNGELFANMQLSSVLSEDSSSGRLVLTNCNTVLLAPVKTKGEEQRKVYEAVIEDKGKTAIYIRLSKRCCEELKLKADREFTAEVQFQLNRLPLCEMHFAVDRLHPPSLVFPDIDTIPNMWNSNSGNLDLEPWLNPKQKEAVEAIITPLNLRLPPVLIIGPFGTGKTFTLAQAVKMILNDPLSRVLVCTHSN